MFDQTFVENAARTRRPWSLAASLTLQAGLLTGALLLPLLHPEVPVLRIERPPVVWRAHVLPTRPEPVRIPSSGNIPLRPGVFRAPLPVVSQAGPRGPETIDAPETSGFIPSGPAVGAHLTSGFATLPPVVEPPKFSRPPAATTPTQPNPQPLRVSTSVQAALLTFGPKPPYPPLAQATRTQGVVRLTAHIAPDGTIANLRVISGHPLLIRAAVDAVQRWRYRPTLLNGLPVEVMTEIDVNFTLSR